MLMTIIIHVPLWVNGSSIIIIIFDIHTVLHKYIQYIYLDKNTCIVFNSYIIHVKHLLHSKKVINYIDHACATNQNI